MHLPLVCIVASIATTLSVITDSAISSHPVMHNMQNTPIELAASLFSSRPSVSHICTCEDCIFYLSSAHLQAARAEAAAWAVEYQPSWTYQDESGTSQGPFHLAELKVMLAE